VVSASGSPSWFRPPTQATYPSGRITTAVGGGGCAEYRELPHAVIVSVDQLDAVGPCSDVKAAGLTEVEQHRLGVVQQLEDPQRAVGGHEVQIGHPASEQGVALAKVVMDVQPGSDRGEPFARLVDARELRHDIDQGLRALVAALERARAIVC
jgi:hypothetical protein